MSGHLLSEYQNRMSHLQAQLRTRRERHLGVRSIIKEIQKLRVKIMRIQTPLPKKIVRVSAETRRV